MSRGKRWRGGLSGFLNGAQRRRAENEMTIFIKIDLDYAIREHDVPNGFKTPQDVTEWLVRSAYLAKYPQGIPSKERSLLRRHGKFENALVRATRARESTVQIEAETLRELREAFDHMNPTAQGMGWYVDFTTELDARIAALDAAVDKAVEAKKGT